MAINKSIIGVIGVLVVVLLLGGIFYAFQSGLLQSTLGDGEYSIDVPDDGRLVKRIFGFAKCEPTGGSSIVGSGNFNRCSEASCGIDYDASRFANLLTPLDEFNEGYGVQWQQFGCPIQAGSQGCNIELDFTSCPSGYTPQIQRDNGLWSNYGGGTIRISEGGQLVRIDFRCAKSGDTNYLGSQLFNPNYILSFPEAGIYVYTEGNAPQGLLGGSTPDCSFVSTNTVSRLVDIQEREAFEIGEKIPLGRDVDLVVGWDDYPLFGNYNPMGQYEGSNVYCSPSASGAEIWEVERTVDILGGQKLYVQGRLLDSGRDFCCVSQELCGGDTVCEGYKCIPTQQAECEFGQCSQFDALGLRDIKYENRAGTFYEVRESCVLQDGLKCLQEELIEIACIPGSCQFGFKCDFEEGCVRTVIKDPCPSGQCCLEGSEDFEVQSCPTGTQCCKGAVDDPFRGQCLISCESFPEEICSDGIDNDGDGLVDTQDPDCQNCIVDGVNLKLAPRDCCIARDKTWNEDTQKCGFQLDARLIVSIIAGLAAFLGLWLGIQTRFGKKKLSKTSKILIPLVALVVGIGLGFIFWYFWTFWIYLTVGAIIAAILVAIGLVVFKIGKPI